MNNGSDNQLDACERDAALIARAIGGDECAFRELVQLYQGAVFACTQAVTRNPVDAADAAQEAFIRFHRNLAQFDPRRPLKPYLMRIAANCSRTMITKRIRRAERELKAEGEKTAVSSPATEIQRVERRQLIRARVDELPETMRQVTSLYYLAECSCREVAEILEMTESAVKVALHRARQRLYREMRELRSAT